MFSQDLQFSSLGSNGSVAEAGETSRDYTRSDVWRQLVAQVESSLCREDRSRQALDQLQQLAAEQGASTQFLLKSVIRETIRITMECLSEAQELLSFSSSARTEETTLKTELKTELNAERLAPPQPCVLTPEETQAQEDASMVTALNHALKPVATPSLLDRLRTPGQPKVSPEVLRQQALEARLQTLRELCDRVHAARLQLGLDLRQIHAETFISLHHLEALDQGKVDRLPEDVYLRGFLRRLEKCLRLPEGDLTSRLPQSIGLTSLPVSHQPLAPHSMKTQAMANPASPSLPFQPNYAYLAYAALMTSGVFWVAQQGAPKTQLAPIKIDTPAPATLQKPHKMSSESVQKVQFRVSQNVSMPEVLV